MAIINKSEITERLIKGLRIDRVRDKVPTQSADKVVPVFIANEVGVLRTIRDDSANSNDKIITVPEGVTWEILHGFIQYQTSGTAGTRQPALQLRNRAGQFIWRTRGITQVATTSENYSLQTGSPEATNVESRQLLPLPSKCILLSGQGIRFFDPNNIDTNDDITISLTIKEISNDGFNNEA